MNEENNMIPIDENLNITKSETENIKNLIYTIRGKQVMLDSDVAMLYQYTTKNINKVFTICLYRTRNIYVSRSSKE